MECNKENKKERNFFIDLQSKPTNSRKRKISNINPNFTSSFLNSLSDVLTPIFKEDFVLKTPDLAKCLLNSPDMEEFIKSSINSNSVLNTPSTIGPVKNLEIYDNFITDFKEQKLILGKEILDKFNYETVKGFNELMKIQVNQDSETEVETETEIEENSELNLVINESKNSVEKNKNLPKVNEDSNKNFENLNINQNDKPVKSLEDDINSNDSAQNKINLTNNSANTQFFNLPASQSNICDNKVNTINNQVFDSSNNQIFSNVYQANSANNQTGYNIKNQINNSIIYPVKNSIIYPISNQIVVQANDKIVNSNNNHYLTPVNNQIVTSFNNQFSTQIPNSVNNFNNQFFNSNNLINNQFDINGISAPKNNMASCQIYSKEKKIIDMNNKIINSNEQNLDCYSLENDELTKLEDKRLRNRIAASKCRRRKLEKIMSLEEHVKNLKQENFDLLKLTQNLKEMNYKLKQEILIHLGDGCNLNSVNSNLINL